jgi:transglutaminase-like putative cysteine protease
MLSHNHTMRPIKPMTTTIRLFLSLFAALGGFLAINLIPIAMAADYEALSSIEKQIVHVTINKDGSYEEIEELTIHIKSQQAVESRSQADIAYSSDHQKVEILDAYTILPDGQKVKVADNAIRTVEDDLASGATMFSDLKHKIIIFPNVKVGARVYYKVKTIEHTPLYPNHFFYAHHFSPSVQYDHVEFNFTYPKDMAMRVKSRDVSGKKTETDNNVSYQYTFKQADIKLSEPAQVAASDFAPGIYFSTFKDYLEYGQAYELRAQDKMAVTPNVKKLSEQITKGIPDRKAQARALYNWVSREIRYVAIYMGNGGIVPHKADDIIRNRYGDCKDKNTLLIALLKAKGIEASSAIINSGSAYAIPELPVFTPFNHVITYLPEWDLYVDATQELSPFGELADHIVGKTTVLTSLNKMGKTPKLSPENNRIITSINIKILPNGHMQGTSQTNFKGNREIAARYKYEGHVTTRAEKMVEDHLYKFRQTGSGKFNTTNVFDLDTPFTLNTEFKLDPITNFPGPGAMTVPVGLSPGNITLISFNKPKEKFYFPYECTSGYIEETTIIEFPKNTKLTRVPKSMHHIQPGSEYIARYKKVGNNKLEVKRSLKLEKKSMICQPEELKLWQTLYHAIKQDMRSQIFYQ